MYNQILSIFTYLILVIYAIISFIALFMRTFTFDNPNSGGFCTNFLRFTLLISFPLCLISVQVLSNNDIWYEPILIILLNSSLFILFILFILFTLFILFILFILSMQLLYTFRGGKF